MKWWLPRAGEMARQVDGTNGYSLPFWNFRYFACTYVCPQCALYPLLTAFHLDKNVLKLIVMVIQITEYTLRNVLYAKWILCIRFFKILSHLWVLCPTVCMCAVYVLSTHRGQKRVSDPLELDLQMAVSHYVGAGNWTHSSVRATSVLNPWALSLAPQVNYILIKVFKTPPGPEKWLSG